MNKNDVRIICAIVTFISGIALMIIASVNDDTLFLVIGGLIIVGFTYIAPRKYDAVVSGDELQNMQGASGGKMYSITKFNSCSVCNPKTLCKKHRISQSKIMVEISEELDLEHDTSLGENVK